MSGPEKNSANASLKRGVYCLANDVVIEWFEAFIRSYQLQNAALPLTVIPFNGNVSRLQSLQARFHFEIMDEAKCSHFDKLANQVMGTDWLAGAYRKFACFFGPYDEFLFLDSDIVILSSLLPLFAAYAGSGCDLVYFDYALGAAYAPDLAARMVTDYGSHGINTGAFLSRKGILRADELWLLAEKAAAVRDGLLPDVLEQSFFNFVFDVRRSRMTGMEKLRPELADKAWARQPLHFDRQTRTATTPDGKILPFIHWPGCGYPTMVRPEIFLEFRTLGMTTGERLDYQRKFYYRRWKRQIRNRLQQFPLLAKLIKLRERLKRP